MEVAKYDITQADANHAQPEGPPRSITEANDQSEQQVASSVNNAHLIDQCRIAVFRHKNPLGIIFSPLLLKDNRELFVRLWVKLSRGLFAQPFRPPRRVDR